MIDYHTYYNSRFRQDINKFLTTVPDQSRFHEDKENKKIFSIQYERLTRDFNHLNFLTRSEKEYFGIGLYFTILTDMVCYTHYKESYAKFNDLTHYPKFIGNCLTMCFYHLNPADIFSAMNLSRNKPHEILSDDRLEFFEKFNHAIPVMEKETISFLEKYLPQISSNGFWDKCKNEFPFSRITEITNE